ncbi:uncharacterized protein LOC125382164 [Haliotis rufescens]|uniref:uncharacterized protein LOC125382164 n=1 Tax=Haliotis rufescens TaxID=6454 RepID=UPI00201F76C7|nr:uncharacterized protein LOC125382164 [Haliotis rufescens]
MDTQTVEHVVTSFDNEFGKTTAPVVIPEKLWRKLCRLSLFFKCLSGYIFNMGEHWGKTHLADGRFKTYKRRQFTLNPPILFTPSPPDLADRIGRALYLAANPGPLTDVPDLLGIGAAVLLMYGLYYDLRMLTVLGVQTAIEELDMTILFQLQQLQTDMGADLQSYTEIFWQLADIPRSVIGRTLSKPITPEVLGSLTRGRDHLTCSQSQLALRHVLTRCGLCYKDTFPMNDLGTNFPMVTFCKWCRRIQHVECAAALLKQSGLTYRIVTLNAGTPNARQYIELDFPTSHYSEAFDVQPGFLEGRVSPPLDLRFNLDQCSVCRVPFGCDFMEVPSDIPPILYKNPAFTPPKHPLDRFDVRTFMNYFRSSTVRIPPGKPVRIYLSQSSPPIEFPKTLMDETRRLIGPLNRRLVETRALQIRLFYPPQSSDFWDEYCWNKGVSVTRLTDWLNLHNDPNET